MRTTVGMCRAIPRPNAGGAIDGRSRANITWRCHFGCYAISRADCASQSRLDIAPERHARRWFPDLRLFVTFSVAIKCAFEISERNDKAGPAVDETKLEDVVLYEGPCCMAERGRHRYAFAG